jgi:hypothetical protein
LKKKTAIDSSGHLQHHLTKLNGLIKTDEYGKYCLSDQGKDALLTIQTVENASPKSNVKEKANGKLRHTFRKMGLKPVAILLVALLIASSAIAVYEYNQVTSNVNKSVNSSSFVTVTCQPSTLTYNYASNNSGLKYPDGILFQGWYSNLGFNYSVNGQALSGFDYNRLYVTDNYGQPLMMLNRTSTQVSTNLNHMEFTLFGNVTDYRLAYNYTSTYDDVIICLIG